MAQDVFMYLEADIKDQKDEIAAAFGEVRAESGRTFVPCL